ncbi:MAG: M14 family zinc carboxypeptidase [Pyrinomonadaceae bacterium]
MSMRQTIFALVTALVISMNVSTQTPEQLALLWENEHVSNIFPSDVRHRDLKNYVEGLKKLGVKIDQVGFSNASREIYQAEWGHGPLKVFLWSQMHGDEPTATSALIDIFTVLQKDRDKEWVKQLSGRVTIRAVPMLNPDGAEAFQRRNLQGIDINRDALDLKTPEARILKRLRDDWNPVVGFNLHNQGSLTTAGPSPTQAAISLLVVYGDADKTPSFGHERNTRLVSTMTLALQRFIPGHIARYSDEWTPTAFGDNFSAWGTPVILIETGELYGKDEMFLVKMNFVAILTALNSLATGSEAAESTSPYLNLPENRSGSLVNFVFRSGNIVARDNLTVPTEVLVTIGDIAAVTERRRASFAAPTIIRGVGNIGGRRGLEEYDASAFYLVPRYGRIASGEIADFYVYKKDRIIDWTVTDLDKQFPPDAIFSAGKWLKGEGVVPRLQ